MFKLEWKEKALNDLEKLEVIISRRIIRAVEEMTEDPFSKDIKKLKGTGIYRLRVGDYRVLFEIEKDLIAILKIGHRQQIY